MKVNGCQTKILLIALSVLGSTGPVGCAEPEVAGVPPGSTRSEPAGKEKEVAPGILLLGTIQNPKITESSGLAASRQFEGVFWTHNDGPGEKHRPVLYAITRDGQSVGECEVIGARLRDWEDISLDDAGHLFIGDLGNNERKRTELAVHQITEPNPRALTRPARVERTWHLRFPGAPFDCESLFIWKGHGYVVSKVSQDARAQIFRFPLSEQAGPVTLALVATTKIQSPVTAAAISPDGTLLALLAKSGPYGYRIEGDVAAVEKVKPHQAKFRHEHAEGCCFVPEGLLVSAETREIYFFSHRTFRGQPRN